MASKLIAKRIKKRRIELGFSQEYMAECLGMGQSNYCKIERGLIVLKAEYLLKLSRILEMNLDKLDLEKTDDISTDSRYKGSVLNIYRVPSSFEKGRGKD